MLVDIPQDLSRADIPYEPVDTIRLPGYQPTTEGNAKQIRLAAKALANARRPGDLRGRRRDQRERARASCASSCTSDQFPVTCTLMGLGAFPATDEQWLGMLGMHGTRTANYAMDEADLICAIGARFDDRITGKLSEFAPRAKFIHIDVDPAEISKNVPAHIPIVGDAKKILPKLTREYRALETDAVAARRLVAAHPAAGRRSTRCATTTSEDSEIKPQCMVEAMYEATGGDAIITSDVGQHQMWAAQYYHVQASRATGSTPAASARWASGCRRRWARRSPAPTRPVVCLAGDGSLHMNMPGAGHLRHRGHPGQGVHHEQRLPRHGPPVAGAVLGRAATRP